PTAPECCTPRKGQPIRRHSPCSPTVSCRRPTCATSSANCAKRSTSAPRRSSFASAAAQSDRTRRIVLNPVERLGRPSTIGADMHNPVLVLVAVACLVAAAVWGRSARYLRKVELRVEAEMGPTSDATALARAAFRKELHTTTLYVLLAVASLAVGIS